MVTTLNNGTPYISNIDYVGPHTVTTTGQLGCNFLINIPCNVMKTVDDSKQEIKHPEETISKDE